MKQIVAVSLLTWGLVAFVPAWGHGSRESPVEFGPMATPAIVHRLHLLGYSDVRVVQERERSIDLEVSRGANRYTVTVSREVAGPDSIAVTNPHEVVERLLRPVPQAPDRPVPQAPDRPVPQTPDRPVPQTPDRPR